MLTHAGLVMTLANSIIGVGILAMPFCFEKCGIILSIVLLVISNWITRICCHYLIKSSLITRRKSIEFLGLHAFGPSGKLLVELCIIGYLLGTCITYFVVIGDLGPQIITKMFAFGDFSHLRTFFMFGVTLLCILPLAMLKNVDSLSTVCTASIGFYFCLVIKIVLESKTHIVANDWTEQVVYWRNSGILQCLPIFSMALSCQMQLFEVFKNVNNQSVEKLNGIVRDATFICTIVYIAVGFFGYVAFCTNLFSGNILLNFSPSFGSDVIKIGFILSVAFSFPLVIFPCRASIYSLLYRKGHADAASGYIPENRFRTITTFIVIFALCIALIIPSVELIIGLVGSTIGVAICIMFPAACFRKISKKTNNESSYSLSSLIIVSGFCLMVLGTYANLQAIDERSSGAHLENIKKNALPKSNNFPAIKEEVLKLIDKRIEPNDDKVSKEENPKLPREEVKRVENLSEKSVKIIEKSQDKTVLLPPVQAPVLPVDEVHKEAPEKEETSIDKIQVDKQLKKLDVGVENLVKPLATQNTQNTSSNLVENVVAAKPPLLQPEIRNQAANSNNLLSIESSKEQKSIQQQTIDKDAIKKDEEIAAEESKNNKANKAAEDELKKTQNELKKTKELLERKVDEIKEELAKQNKETQDLVVEKLVEVVEKVEKIEREVQKKDENLKTAQKKENLQENNYLISASNVPKSEIVSQSSNKLDETKQKSLLVQLTAPYEPSNDNKDKPKPGEVYEPLSYKTGELIEHARNANILEQRLPLPLALLINSSRIKLKDEENSNTNLNSNSNQLNLQTSTASNLKNLNDKSKENVEAIRRDILQLNTENSLDSNAKSQNPNENELSNSHQRIKRELEIEKQNLPKSNEESLSKDNCLIAPKIQTLLQHGSSAGLNLKMQSIGRDLKSLKDDERE